MRCLAGAGISMSPVRALRSYGHEVVHLSEGHLERLLDPAILEKARQGERLVLTFDLDFGEFLATGARALPSVILLRMRDQTPSSVTSRSLDVLSERSASLRQALSSSCRTHVTGCADSRSARLKVGTGGGESVSLHLGPSHRSDVFPLFLPWQVRRKYLDLTSVPNAVKSPATGLYPRRLPLGARPRDGSGAQLGLSLFA